MLFQRPGTCRRLSISRPSSLYFLLSVYIRFVYLSLSVFSVSYSVLDSCCHSAK